MRNLDEDLVQPGGGGDRRNRWAGQRAVEGKLSSESLASGIWGGPE